MAPSSSLSLSTAIVAAVAYATQFASAADATTTYKTVAVSGDIATGLFIGFFLVGMLLFAVTMMMDIATSDMLGTKRETQ